MRTVVLAVLLFLVFAARASAAPFVLGTGELPDVAVDGAGVAYIAWNGTETGDPAHFCRLPRGAVACDVSLTLPLPTAIAGSVTRPVVHVSGSRVIVLHYFYGEYNGLAAYQSDDRGATFQQARRAGALAPYGSAFGPGDTVSVVTSANGAGMLFQNLPLVGATQTAFANLDTTRPYNGAVGLDGATPVVIAMNAASVGIVRRYVAGDVNNAPSWSAPVDVGYLDYPVLAGGPLGLWVLAGDESGSMFVRRFDGTNFGPRVTIGPGDASEASLYQDAGGRMHAVYPRLDASGYHAMHAVSDDGLSWRVGELEVRTSDEQGTMRVSMAADHVGVAVWKVAGPSIVASSVGPDAPVAVQPPPVPTPPVPTPDPAPVFEQSVVVKPISGKVLVRLKGSSRFVPLGSIDDVPLGATVDARKGRIELRAVNKRGGPVEVVQLYKGMFRVDQKRGITNFTLNEPLAPCSSRGRAAAKKPKSRKLWGDGKGAFRTTGKYSAATVRGTRWLVQDSCKGTLTRVAAGAVNVTLKVKKPVIIVRAGKSYLARAPRR